MLRHLRTLEGYDMSADGSMAYIRYADPSLPESWEDDPCTFCGGESFPARCPGDGAHHHHGAIHPPPSVSGFWFLCRSPECHEKARAAWADEREMRAACREVGAR